MGTRCSSELRRGHIYITMKLILLTVFAAVALAEDAPAETEAAAPVAKAFVYSGLHQLHWPGYYGHGFSSQCWGCRGKRSAEAEPEADPGLVYGHPFGYYGFAPPVYVVKPDLTLAGKDEGVAAHPGDATAWTQRSAQGAYAGLVVGRKRRSADPGLLYHPYAYHLPVYHSIVPVAPAVAPISGEGVAAHPNAGTSKVGPTTWG